MTILLYAKNKIKKGETTDTYRNNVMWVSGNIGKI